MAKANRKPKTPTVVEPSSVPAPNVGIPELLGVNDAVKYELEVEKLREEISNMKKASAWSYHAFHNVKLNEWIVAGAAGLALLSAWSTEIFDATRQNLSAQQERLLIEKLNLEAKRERLTADVKLKQADLEVLKNRLLPFEHEEAAVQELRKLRNKSLGVSFSVTPENDGFELAIQPYDEKLRWDFDAKSRTNPALTDALRTANNLRAIKGLRIRELTMSNEDVMLATQHREMETLIIQFGSLETLSGLRQLPNLRTLDLARNNLKSLEGCPSFPNVNLLNLDNNPLGDDALASVASLFTNLMSLQVSGTAVSDAGMKHVTKLNLSSITLEGTRVTGQGILTLLDCPSIKTIEIAKDVITPAIRTILKQKRPNDLTLIHLDANEKARRAFVSVNQW